MNDKRHGLRHTGESIVKQLQTRTYIEHIWILMLVALQMTPMKRNPRHKTLWTHSNLLTILIIIITFIYTHTLIPYASELHWIFETIFDVRSCQKTQICWILWKSFKMKTLFQTIRLFRMKFEGQDGSIEEHVQNICDANEKRKGKNYNPKVYLMIFLPYIYI